MYGNTTCTLLLYALLPFFGFGFESPFKIAALTPGILQILVQYLILIVWLRYNYKVYDPILTSRFLKVSDVHQRQSQNSS